MQGNSVSMNVLLPFFFFFFFMRYSLIWDQPYIVTLKGLVKCVSKLPLFCKCHKSRTKPYLFPVFCLSFSPNTFTVSGNTTSHEYFPFTSFLSPPVIIFVVSLWKRKGKLRISHVASVSLYRFVLWLRKCNETWTSLILFLPCHYSHCQKIQLYFCLFIFCFSFGFCSRQETQWSIINLSSLLFSLLLSFV